MAGFSNVREFVESYESGKYFISHFRKNPAIDWNGAFDSSYFGAIPVANYYASSPLEAAFLNRDRGILHARTGGEKYLTRATLMMTAALQTSNFADNYNFFLCDYIAFYPFVDGTAAAEVQTFINDALDPLLTQDRYNGKGTKVMIVCQAASTTGGIFSFEYVNQDGVTKTSPTQRTGTNLVIPTGAIAVTQQISAAGASDRTFPFCQLASGDTGVQKINSITFNADVGGLYAFVLVRPLCTLTTGEACRVNAGVSFGGVTEKEFFSTFMQMPVIDDNAFLGIVTNGGGRSVYTNFTGTLEMIWR